MLGLGVFLGIAKKAYTQFDSLFGALKARSTYYENDGKSRSEVSRISSAGILDDATILLTPTATSNARVHSVKTYAGDELVDDGDFALTGTQAASTTGTYWDTGDSWTISNNKASYDGTTNGSILDTFCDLQNTNTYEITLTISDNSGRFRVSIDGGTADYNTYTTGNGTYKFYFVASSTNLQIRGSLSDSAATFSVSNVSVKDVSSDFDFDRASSATRINSSANIEDITSDLARINYDSNGENGHILLEPTSTNLITYSEQFGGATDYFDNYNQASEVSNNNLAPDGTNTATQIVSTGDGKLQTSSYISLPANTTYTLSFFAKNVDATEVKSRILADGGSGGSNLTSVSYVSQINTSTWTRITHTFTTNSTSQSYILYLSNALNSGGNIQLWGAQLEELSYATSYIPTLTGSTVTRAAETLTGSGNTSLIGQTSGTLYAEIEALADTSDERRISISDGTASIKIGFNSSNYLIAQITDGTTTYSATESSTTNLQMNKIAVRYESGNNNFYVNGVQSTGAVFRNGTFSGITLSSLACDNDGGGGTQPFVGKIKTIIVFDTPLDNTTLATLTTQ